MRLGRNTICILGNRRGKRLVKAHRRFADSVKIAQETMTLKQFVEDAISKVPHPSVWGEVCDLVTSKIESIAGPEQARIAGDYFCKLAQEKGWC